MSNCEYFASRTPSATFSKSQNTARLRASGLAGTLWNLRLSSLVDPGLKPLEVEVDHRGDVKRQDLRQQQAADHRDAQRHARAATGAEADGDRQGAHQAFHGGDHDRPGIQQA